MLALSALLLCGTAFGQAGDCVDYSEHMHLTATVPGEARFLDRAGDYVYTSSLQIIDVSLPGAPVVVGSIPGQDGDVRGIQAAGGLLGIVFSAADGTGFNGLALYDLTLPAAPSLLGTVAMDQFMTELKMVGDRVYIRNDQGRLLIVDISDPSAPTARGSIGQGWLDSFDLRGDWLYAVDQVQDDVVAIDVTDPDNLSVDYRLPLSGIISIDFGPAYGYFLHETDGTAIVMFTAPGEYSIEAIVPEMTRPLVLDGDLAYAYGLPLEVYGLTNPIAPTHVLTAPFVIHDGLLDGDRLLVGLSNAFAELAVGALPGTPAVTGLDLESTLTGIVPVGQSGVATLSRMGLETWDASDCAAPQLRGGVMWQGNVLGQVAAGDHLFVLFQNPMFGRTDLKVYDLSDLGAPAEIGAATLNFELRGLVAAGDYLYSAQFDGLVVVDVSDPTMPAALSLTDGVGFSALAAVDGAEMVVADGTMLRHFSLADPAGPQLVTSVDTGHEAVQVLLHDGLAVFVHEGGALLYGVQALGAKNLLGEVLVPGISNGAALDGDVLYVEGSGFFVFDLSDPTLPVPVGSLGYEADRADHAVVVGSCLYFDHYLSNDRGRLVIAPTHCTGDDPVEGPHVMIDIKPGSEVNPINCRSLHGVIPVAILTTEEFDALTVDHNTVRFGPGEAPEAHAARGRDCRGDDGDDDDNDHDGDGDDDKALGGADKGRGGDRGRGHGRGHDDCDRQVKRHVEDVDGDGDLDLVFHFEKSAALIACGDTEAWLFGETFDGEAFSASDVVCTTPRCCRDEDEDDDGDDPDKGLVNGIAPRLALAPNPFNPQTTVAFDLPRSGHVRIEVFDVTGRRVAVVADASFTAGSHRATWTGTDQGGRPVASGVYFVRLTGPGVTLQQRAMLLK